MFLRSMSVNLVKRSFNATTLIQSLDFVHQVKRPFVLCPLLLRKEVKNEIVKDIEDSPIKKPIRKRAAFIDSDEDSQDSEKKFVASNCILKC